MKTSKAGVDVVDLLGLLFVGLKLTDQIDWSWWWVLLPFYGAWVAAIVWAPVAGVLKAIRSKGP